MWTTRQNHTVRLWVQAVTNAGYLRPGLKSNDFHVVIITPNDSSSYIPIVTESSQRPGNYYFDVPASFMVANGTGEYNVSIEIDTRLGSNTSPNIRSSESKVLVVTHDDIDTVSGSIWNAVAATYNVTGTMGYQENLISMIQFSSSLDVQSVVSGVWNAAATTFDNPGTMGELENMLLPISQSVSFTQGVENGTWVITGSQMVFFTSGANVELARFNLQDINGFAIDPSSQTPFRRVRI